MHCRNRILDLDLVGVFIFAKQKQDADHIAKMRNLF
jgi:hypothetical protein